MSEPRPRLEVVSASPAPDPAAEQPRGRERRPGPWRWVLVGLLALALVTLGFESRRAEQLAAEVGALRGELAASQAAVEAQRKHLDEVRGAVDRLQELVSRDPVAEAPPAP